LYRDDAKLVEEMVQNGLTKLNQVDQGKSKAPETYLNNIYSSISLQLNPDSIG